MTEKLILSGLAVQQMFATPIAVGMVPDAEKINIDLEKIILAREQHHPSTQHSNLGGWQSSWDMEAWGGKSAAAILAAGKSLATQLTADRQGHPTPVSWKANCWANINRSGHGNEFHCHPGAYWSGSYYINDGGVAADPGLGGEFEIQDPRGPAPVMYAPLLTFAVPGGLTLGSSELLSPRAGMMVLFPSWLMHAVRPYHGTQTRISMAFNFSL